MSAISAISDAVPRVALKSLWVKLSDTVRFIIFLLFPVYVRVQWKIGYTQR